MASSAENYFSTGQTNEDPEMRGTPEAEGYKQKSEQYAAEAEGIRSRNESGPVGAFLGGAADALLGPLPSMLAAATLAPEEIAIIERNKEKHNIAAGAGNLLGYVGGALAGVGVPGLLTKGGAAVARGAATLGGVASRLGGQSALGAVLPGAGFVAGQALEGGGIALSEATSKSIIDNAMGLPGSGATIAESVGKGMALGGAAGVAGIFVPRGANWLFGRAFKDRIATVAKAKEKSAKLGEQYNAATSRIEQIEASMTPQQLKNMRESVPDSEYNRLVGAPGRKNVVDKPTYINGRPVPLTETVGPGGVVGRPVIAELRAGIKQADDKVYNALNKALKDAGDSATDAGAEILATGVALSTGNPGAVLLRKIIMPSVRAVQRTIYSGMMHIPPIRFIMSASLHAGKPSWQKMVREGGRYVHRPVKYEKYLDATAAAIKASKIPALTMMTRKDYNEITDELVTSDPSKMDMAIRYGLAAQGLPQEIAGPILDQQLRVSQFLLGKLPPVSPKTWSGNERPRAVPQSHLASFSRYYRAAMVPASVMDDLANGRLTRESAEAWWANNPEVAQEFADQLMQDLATAESFGRVFSAAEKKQFALILDPQSTQLGRTKDPMLVQSLQNNYASEEAQAPPAQLGGPKPPGDPKAASGMNQSVISPSQGLTDRLARR